MVVQPASGLITVEGLCEKLQISRATLWRLSSAGKVPSPMKLGRGVRWLSGEIDEWLAAGMPDRRSWQAMKTKKRGAAAGK